MRAGRFLGYAGGLVTGAALAGALQAPPPPDPVWAGLHGGRDSASDMFGARIVLKAPKVPHALFQTVFY